MKYLIGKDYPDLCQKCQDAIDSGYEMIITLCTSEEYIEDSEGPSMFAYDRGWLCDWDCPE